MHTKNRRKHRIPRLLHRLVLLCFPRLCIPQKPYPQCLSHCQELLCFAIIHNQKKHIIRCLLHRRELWQSRFLLPTSCTLPEHRSEFQNAEYTYNHLIIKVSSFYIIVTQFSFIYVFILTRQMNQKQDIRYKFWFWKMKRLFLKMKRSKSFVSG